MASVPSTPPAAMHISKQDVQHTVNTYTDLVKAANKYHRKLLELASTATEFANALDAVSQCKAASQSGIGMKAAAELHRVISKQNEQLGELVNKDFEVPLQRNLATHQKRIEDNEKQFEKSMRKVQDEIAKTENKMLKGRKKDLTAFQQSLQDMQRQAQEMEQLKHAHADKVLQDEQKNFMFIVQKAAGLVKNEFDHYSTLSGISRDVTEDIITIAFTPSGKTLDAAEKRRVVDKFLGSNSTTAAAAAAGTGSRPESIYGSQAALASGHLRSSMSSSTPVSAIITDTQTATERRPTIGSVTSQIRPATPPVSPQPDVAATVIASSSGAVKSSPFLRADSSASSTDKSKALDAALDRLNKAASNLTTNTASTVGADDETNQENQVKVSQGNTDGQWVVAIHDFTARSDRELSFKKHDILLVKQRQESWLYATHHNQTNARSGWVPVSYTKPHQA